jgi:hypothetical protein
MGKGRERRRRRERKALRQLKAAAGTNLLSVLLPKKEAVNETQDTEKKVS